MWLDADDAPIRASSRWRPPARILVTGASAPLLRWLAPAAPGVELVAIEGAEDGLREVASADAVIGWYTPEMVERGERLAWLQVHTAGVEGALRSPLIAERGIVVTNLKRVAGPVIGEHVFAMLLSLTRRLGDYRDRQRRGRWAQFEIPERSLGALRGKTMLVAGLGGIGMEVARLARAFGMRVTGIRASGVPAAPFVEDVGTTEDLPRLARDADVIVNALPLTDATRGLFDARVFQATKREAIFVNVSRGASVVTDDLMRALREGRIAGAALDVVEPEPLPADHPLWRMDNVVVTPHVAGLAAATQDRRWLVIRENLRRYVAGEPMLSVVRPERGY